MQLVPAPTVRPIKKPTKTFGWEIRAGIPPCPGQIFGRFQGVEGGCGVPFLKDISRQSVPKFAGGVDSFVFVESADYSVE